MKKIFYLIILIVSLAVNAHQGKTHSSVQVEENSSYDQINEMYLSEIKSIFEKKCFDCHGSQVTSRWYRNLPGAKQLIEYDIKESKVHLDMTTDFPFKSHGSPLEDLEAIQKSIEENQMPPLRYRLMHSGSSLDNVEKEKLYKWVQFGKKLLKENIK